MRIRLCPILLLFLAAALPSFAATPDHVERILDFHSDITLLDDGTFLVRETIQPVDAAGQDAGNI